MATCPQAIRILEGSSAQPGATRDSLGANFSLFSANAKKVGLAASIWSTDVDRPLRVARQLEAGTVWINNWAIVYAETEEGGYKQSGLGRLDGVSGMDDFVEYRTIIHEIDLGRG
jgi:acyl-CoA reductase-like NAD-dependent aldehyde dehydrogenase